MSVLKIWNGTEWIETSSSVDGKAPNMDYWSWSATVGGVPATNEIRTDNATPASVTAVLVSETSIASVDRAASLQLLGANDVIEVRQNASTWLRFRVTGTPTDSGTYQSIPVAYLAHSGTMTAAAVTAIAVFPDSGLNEGVEVLTGVASESTDGSGILTLTITGANGRTPTTCIAMNTSSGTGVVLRRSTLGAGTATFFAAKISDGTALTSSSVTFQWIATFPKGS